MIQHRILKTKNYAFIEVKGTPQLAELLSAARLFVSDLNYSPNLHRVYDFSQADISHITLGELLRLTRFSSEQEPLGSETRIALVASHDERNGALSAFASRTSDATVRIFHDPHNATEWVQRRPYQSVAEGPFCKLSEGSSGAA